jgi:hypothetical protein
LSERADEPNRGELPPGKVRPDFGPAVNARLDALERKIERDLSKAGEHSCGFVGRNTAAAKSFKSLAKAIDELLPALDAIGRAEATVAARKLETALVAILPRLGETDRSELLTRLLNAGANAAGTGSNCHAVH